MKNHTTSINRYLIITSITTTYNIVLYLLVLVLFLVTINNHISFKLNFLALNFIQNIIIISICHTNMISLYGLICLDPVTNSFRGVLDICYSGNIKTLMNNCACWNHDILLQLVLFPMPIGFFLSWSKYILFWKIFHQQK